MYEWILVVWLVSCGPEICTPAPAFPVGTYRKLDDCVRASATVTIDSESVSFVALCVERDK